MADRPERKNSQQSTCSSSTSSSFLLDVSSINAYDEEALLGSHGAEKSSHHGAEKSSHHGANKPSSPHRHCRPRQHASLAAVSCALSVSCFLLLLAGLLLFFLYVQPGEGATEATNLSPVCMPCDQIRPNPLAPQEAGDEDGAGEESLIGVLDVRVDKERDTEMCCASTPPQYAALFKLILRRQEEVKKVADIMGSDVDDDAMMTDVNGSGKKASAHLLVKPRNFDADMHVQHWKSPAESPASHVQGGLQFLRNGVHVHTQGIYFIYCQILYNPAASSSSSSSGPLSGVNSPFQVASHYVKRHSVLHPASPAMLLKARHTRTGGLGDRHSSYVGGLFFLHPGDELYVHVSVPDLISHDDSASFFGLFRVSD